MLTPESRRRHFPTLEGMAYLNTAAEGIPPLAVNEALHQYFIDHQLGMDGRDKHFAQLAELKKLTAAMYGLTPDEIGVCSCSSEAYNLAAQAIQLRAGDEVVINDLDYPAGVTPWLQSSSPATVKLWKSRDWQLHLEDLIPLLGPRTRLVPVSLVSYFNGFTLSLPPLLQAVRKHSPALVSVDVTQALGRIPMDLRGVDLIVSSTHKWILACHGGGLVGVPAARANALTTQAGGWFNIEDAFGPNRFEKAVSKPGAAGFSVGMPNFPAIYAVRAALEYIQSIGVPQIHAAAQPLVLACIEGLTKMPVELITATDPAILAGIISFRHPQAEAIHRALHQKNVHVMYHSGRMRVAIHGYNTANDVERFLRSLSDTVATI